MVYKNSNKIRIGYLMHGIGYGGAVNSLLILLQNLDKEKFEIFIYTISSSVKELEEEFRGISDSFKIVNLPTISFNQIYQDSLKAFYKKINHNIDYFNDILIKDGIDILHINSSLFANVIKSVKEKTKLKVICHQRELIPDTGRDRVIRDYIIEKTKIADRIIAISDNEAEYYKDSTKLITLPNPIDFELIESIKKNSPSKVELNHRAIIIGMTGQFHKEKGHLTFLKSLNILINDYCITNIRFKIIGVKKKDSLIKYIIKKILKIPDYRNEVLSFINNNNLNKFVDLIPLQKNILNELNKIDIYVRPSSSADPWGRDIIEAMALSKPVIATGNSEFYIKNNINGYLINANNPIQLAQKIYDLVLDVDKRIEFGITANRIVKENCDAVKYCQKMSDIYINLIRSLA